MATIRERANNFLHPHLDPRVAPGSVERMSVAHRRKNTSARGPALATRVPPGPPSNSIAGESARLERLQAQARQRALNAWHRMDLSSLEAPWQDCSRATSAVMPLVLSRLGLEQRLAESQILQVWDRVMDRTITAHAKPVGLRRGTLFISVDSNTWLSELVRYRYAEMLEKLQLSVGKEKVERLSLRVG